jgi:hypothetical protein
MVSLRRQPLLLQGLRPPMQLVLMGVTVVIKRATPNLAVLPDAAASASLYQRPSSPRRKPPR